MYVAEFELKAIRTDYFVNNLYGRHFSRFIHISCITIQQYLTKATSNESNTQLEQCLTRAITIMLVILYLNK